MTIYFTWRLPRPDGWADIGIATVDSHADIVSALQMRMPDAGIRSERVTYVELGDGRRQVNLHAFGPVGVVGPEPDKETTGGLIGIEQDADLARVLITGIGQRRE